LNEAITSFFEVHARILTKEIWLAAYPKPTDNY
jgi:hypothetical protein